MPHLNTNVTAPTASQSYPTITIHRDTACCRHVNTDSKATTCPFLPARFSLISGRLWGCTESPKQSRNAPNLDMPERFTNPSDGFHTSIWAKSPKNAQRWLDFPVYRFETVFLHCMLSEVLSARLWTCTCTCTLQLFPRRSPCRGQAVPILIGPVVFWMSADMLS